MQRQSIYKILAACAVMAVATVLSESAQAGALFFTDFGQDVINKSDPDGTNLTTLLSVGNNAVDLAIEGNTIYWTENITRKIRAANLDGSNPRDVVTGLGAENTAIGLAIDPAGGRVYWTDELADEIWSANLDGSDSHVVLNVGTSNPYAIRIDPIGQKMYWTESSGISIRRANLDGSNVELLFQRTGEVGTLLGLAIDPVGGKMYWTDRTLHRISRSNLDGSMVEPLVTGGDYYRGIAVDPAAGKLYWADAGNAHKIQMSNLDGTGVVDIVTGLDTPSGVAFLVPEPTTGTLALVALLGLLRFGRRRKHSALVT